MALIAHYRLDGEVIDSVGNISTTVYGNFEWVDGKFGTAAFTNSTSQYFEADTGPLRKDLSIAFWYRCDEIPTTWTSIVSKLINDQENEINLRFSADGNGMQYYYGNSSVSNRIINFSRTELIPSLGEWVHITITKKAGDQLRIYSNGELIRSTNIPDDLAFDTSRPLKILNHSGNETPVGAMQDLRVYDHSLSSREVRDLALGMTTHITFDNLAEPTQNFVVDPLFNNGLDNWSLWSGNGNRQVMSYKYNGGGVVRCTLNTAGNIGIVSQYTLSLAADEWAVLSVDVRASRSTTLNYTYLMRQNNNNSNFSTQAINPTWKRVEIPIQNSIADTCAVLLGFNQQAGDWVEFANPMLERGRKASYEFTEGVREASGNNLALQGGSVTGGSFRLSEDAQLGRLCYDNRLGEARSVIVPGTPAVTGNQTLSMWIYPTSFATRTNPWNKGYGSEGTITQETSGRLNYFYGSGNGNTTPYLSHTAATALTLNQWNHVCHVRDVENNIQRWYINGVEDAATRTAELVPGKSSLDLWIGDGYAGPNYPGMIDDVREYATALTSEQARELYEQRASIDSEGSFHTHLISDGLAFKEDWETFDGYSLVRTSIEERDKGYLRLRTTEGDPWVTMYGIGTFNPNEYRYIHIKYRVIQASSSGMQIFFTNAEYSSATWAQQINDNYNTDGDWHVLVIDGQQHSNWLNSDITGWRFDWTSSGTTEIEFEYIALSKYKSLSVESTGNFHANDFSEVGITRSLVAWLPLDADTDDYTGNIVPVNNGAIPSSRGYEFDGESYISLGSYTASKFCASFWINVHELSVNANNNYRRIISHSSIGNLILIEQDGGVSFRVPGVNEANYKAGNVVLNEWTHVACQYDQQYRSIFVNGVLVGQQDIGPGTPTLNNLQVTNSGGVNAQAFIGQIEQVRIYDKALTANEINMLYKMTDPTNQTRMSQSNQTLYVKNQLKEVAS